MRTLALMLSIAASSFAQDAGMKARQMYLQPSLDPTARGQKWGGAQGKATQTKTSPNQPAGAKDSNSGPNPTGSSVQETPPVVPVALHLGLRYNVLKVDPDAKLPTVAVDPKTVFRTGDCLAILLRPNRSGFMYVFNVGTTDPWQTLLPNPRMPNESNRIQAGVNTQVPRDYCFKVGGAPGTENLVVVLTERDEDQHSLDDSIRRSLAGEVVIAMTSRDLEIQEVGRPLSSDEPPYSVYIVKTAAEKGDRMVIEIKLRHE